MQTLPNSCIVAVSRSESSFEIPGDVLVLVLPVVGIMVLPTLTA